MSTQQKNKYEIDMYNGSILKKMLLFSFPLIISGILQLLFNAADVVVVGRFAGDNALAAVGSCGSLINLLTNVFIGMSTGANVVAARFYGAKKDKDVQNTVHTAMLLSFICGVILTIIGFFGAHRILLLMQVPEEVLPLSVTYIKIYFLGMTATMIYNFGSSLLRAIGDTKRPLYYLLTAGVINIILNLIFVIAFKMSVAGVALATVISQIISAVLVVLCLMRENNALKLNLKKLRIDKRNFIMILQIGLPAGLQGSVFALSNVVIQSSINTFGNISVAGNSAAGNIEGFVYVAMNAFYQAALSFTSQNLGAGRFDRIKKIILFALSYVTLLGLISGNLVCFFGETLVGFYSDNPDVIAAGINRLSVVCRFYFLCGLMDVMCGVLRGLGTSVTPMVVSMLGACGLRLLWIATIFQIEQFHTLKSLYFSYPISWSLTFLAHLICTVFVYRKILKHNTKTS